MNEASLPSPDTGANGYHLRRVAVKALQSLDMIAPRYPNGAHPGAAKLAAFFTACATAATSIGKQIANMVVTPTVNNLAVGGTQQLTVAKGGSTGAVTYLSRDTARVTVSSTGLVTAVKSGAVRVHIYMAEDATYKAADRTVEVIVA